MQKLLALFLLSFGSASSLAQPALVSPEVHADGRVTFRLEAPAAQNVLIRGEAVAGEATMSQDAPGIWSFTTPPLAPDIYVYTFHVDGVRLTDPRNPLLKFNLLSSESQVHVPGPSTLPWEINDVPRGQVHRHYYRSALAGDDRDFLVYTPPGYDPRAGETYPVLYLLHGYSDDATAWTHAGYAHVILDNLISRGEARPMIVVMPLGYGTMEVIRVGWRGIRNPDGTRPEVWWRNIALFRTTLLEEVMPQVERGYRVKSDRNHRAVVGLSMGAAQALDVGFNALDHFSEVAAFSAGGLSLPFARAYPTLIAPGAARPHLLWIGCGVHDDLLGLNRQLHQWLELNNVRHQYLETPGGHTYRVWRRYLAEVVPLLFRE